MANQRSHNTSVTNQRESYNLNSSNLLNRSAPEQYPSRPEQLINLSSQSQSQPQPQLQLQQNMANQSESYNLNSSNLFNRSAPEQYPSRPEQLISLSSQSQPQPQLQLQQNMANQRSHNTSVTNQSESYNLNSSNLFNRSAPEQYPSRPEQYINLSSQSQQSQQSLLRTTNTFFPPTNKFLMQIAI